MDKTTLFSPRLSWLLRSTILLLLVVLPLFSVQDYFIHILSMAFILAIAALGMQLLLGFAGQLSLGQAAFLGIGAYTSAILTKLGLPFPFSFLASGILAAILSLALVPIVRLQGVYLGVATLGFTIIVHLVLQNEEWLTGGTFGFMNIPHPHIGTFALDSSAGVYYLCLGVLAVVYLALSLLVNSRIGRALGAIMLNEEAARASGINPTLYKCKCFVVAAMVTGFAGSLFAHHSMYLNPNDFTLWRSIEILIMAAVGGLGSLPGAIVGAFVVVLLPEFLRSIDDYRMVIYGGLLVILMGLGQAGLAGLMRTATIKTLARLRARKAPSTIAARVQS